MNEKVTDLRVVQRLSDMYQSKFVTRHILPNLDSRMGTVRILLVRPKGNQNLRYLHSIICDDLHFDIDVIIDDDQPPTDIKSKLERDFPSDHIRFGEVVNLSDASPDILAKDYRVVFVEFDDIYGQAADKILNLLRKNRLVKGNLIITFPLLFRQPEPDASLFGSIDQNTGTTIMQALFLDEGDSTEIKHKGIPQDLKGFFDKCGFKCRLNGMSIYTGVDPENDPAFIPIMILAYEIS